MKRKILISQTPTTETPIQATYVTSIYKQELIQDWMPGFNKDVDPVHTMGQKDPVYFIVTAEVYTNNEGFEFLKQIRQHATQPWKEQNQHLNQTVKTLREHLEVAKVDKTLTMRDCLMLYAVGIVTGVVGCFGYANWF